MTHQCQYTHNVSTNKYVIHYRPPGVTPNRGMGPPWGAFCQITWPLVTYKSLRNHVEKYHVFSSQGVLTHPTHLVYATGRLYAAVYYKKLSCRRETARCFMSLKIWLSRSLKITQGHSKWHCCVRRVQVHISISVTLGPMSVSRTVSEIGLFSVKEWRDLETVDSGRSRSLKIAPIDWS